MTSLKIFALKSATTTALRFALSALIILISGSAFGAPKKPEENSVKAPKVLPLVTYFDSVKGEVYNWWAENKTTGDMEQLSKTMNKSLGQERYINPAQFNRTLEGDLQKTALSGIQKIKIAKLYEAIVVVTGGVTFSKSPVIEQGTRVKVQLLAEALRGGRAEMVRILDLPRGEAEKLKTQSENVLSPLFEQVLDQLIAQKAKPAQVELVVSGKLSQQQLEGFKKWLKQSVQGVGDVRETAYENEQVALSLNYAGSTEQLRASLQKLTLPTYRTQIISHDDKRVFYDIKAQENNKR